jgi:hypothetical protein
MAGSKSDDKAATALATALEVCSMGAKFVRGRSGIVGASWRPAKGGWVVHNTAWALWGGLPFNILSRAVENFLENPEPEDFDRYGPIPDAASRSYWAGKGEENLATTFTLEDGTAFSTQPQPRERLPQVGSSMFVGDKQLKVVELS